MATELGSSESIVFGHKVELKGSQGKLMVTTVSLLFTPSDGKAATQVPWSNVKKTQKNNPSKDKNGRVGFRVECETGPPLNFFLTGDRVEVMTQEQVKLHGVAVKILASRGQVPPAMASSSGSGANKRTISQAQDGAAIVNESDEKRKARLLEARKRQILEADQHLGKSYRDLVENSKVIDEEEFWTTHMPDYAAKLHVDEDEAGAMKKGRLNSLKAANGKINLTTQDRKDILENEPIIRLAYDELVPNQKSEKEFWTLYIEKTYFKHAQNKSRQAMELFAGFEEKARRKSLVGASSSSASSSGNIQAALSAQSAATKSAVSKSVGTKFDILHNYHDFDIKESYDGEDRFLQDSKDLKRINNESKMVLTAGESGGSASNGVKNMSREEVAELRAPAARKYAPLKISRPNNQPSVEAVESSGSSAPAKKSAFGKAKSAFGKTKNTAEISVGTTGEVIPPRNMTDVLEGITECFPEASRASTCLDDEKTLLREQAILTERMVRVEAILKSGQSASAGIVDLTMGDSEDHPESLIRTEVEEKYNSAIELLRHFYAILLREGPGKPTKGSQGAEKIEKLLQRLWAIKDQLMTKSRGMNDKLRGRKLESSQALCSEVIKLVSRGDQWWSNYKSRVHI